MTRAAGAEFLDGWSLEAQAVSVTVGPDQLWIVNAEGRELGRWSQDGLQCDAMQEGCVLHVTHRSVPHETLVVRDADLAAQITALAPRLTSLPGGAHTGRFVLACLLALAALAGLIHSFAPTVARYAASKVPLERERALGAQMELFLDRATCTNPRIQAALGALEERLRANESERFELRLMEADQPNAFALPGGVILLTKGLVREAESSDEIAGVLAHEMEHVSQRHVLAGVLRDALLSGLWAITAGDYAGLLVVDPSTAYRAANLHFSREDEEAADRGAALRLVRAGISHAGLVAFFERLRAKHGDQGPAWLSTHPATEERIKRLKAMADVSQRREPLSAKELAVLRAGCTTEGGGAASGDHAPKVGTQIWYGGVIELVAGFLIAAGLFTRCAAFVASGTMAVAYTQFHWKLQLDSGFFPAINKGELALLYAFLFLYMACRGAGHYSLDVRR